MVDPKRNTQNMAAAANQKARQVVEEDLANVEFETSEDVEVIPTFDSMGLREDLLRGIYAYGMLTPLKFCKPIDSGCLFSRGFFKSFEIQLTFVHIRI